MFVQLKKAFDTCIDTSDRNGKPGKQLLDWLIFLHLGLDWSANQLVIDIDRHRYIACA